MYYHFFAPLIARCNINYLNKWFKRVENGIINIQKKRGIDRQLYCGANWYSITHDLAEEFCMHRKEIINKVRWSISSDECVLQTFYRLMAKGSYELFDDNIDEYDHRAAMREIDWHRGKPYVWRDEDFDFLINSEMMFARKFDERIDAQIIKRIVDVVK